MTQPLSPSIFGIRHHGPGSARSLRQALATLQPDIILVEGPPDAQHLLPWVADAGMQPPVALLIHRPDQPRQAVYYPFAVFSPEWQALQYALARGLAVRLMDLPQANQLALRAAADSVTDPTTSEEAPAQPVANTAEGTPAALRTDPLHWVAQATGYSDGERWWEHQVEQRQESRDLFTAILELMTALRTELVKDTVATAISGQANELQLEAQREAAMRQAIRSAQQEGFTRIAVVCGAWHAPALQDLSDAKGDAACLRGLPKVKVTATWVPWTYGRLSWQSGYGAGVGSPGWYDHLWQAGERQLSPAEITTTWLTRIAHLFREKDLVISTAHVIEGVRLAEALAALRQRPLPGLPELTEAVQSVFCFGDSLPLQLVHEALIVGERLGSVPNAVPTVPLQADLARQQKRLRLPPEAVHRDLDLDLRKANDLARSHLLHRLHLLDIPWGTRGTVGGARGTFHELWRLQWTPELSIAVIEASLWGNTIAAAATARTVHLAAEATTLASLTALVSRLLLANLPDALDEVLVRLQEMAAVTNAVDGLMAALPPLVRALRYGDVRSTDAAMLGDVVAGLVVRICVGLPQACASLDGDAAAAMLLHITDTHSSIALLQVPEHLAIWQDVLSRLVNQSDLHGLLAGRICRLLLESGVFDADETARRMGLALSAANEAATAAAWVDGFLRGSGALLIHDRTLWQILDRWVTALSGEQFTLLLPLLRRTFATFTGPERQQMGRQVTSGRGPAGAGLLSADRFAPERGDAMLPVLAQLLGIVKE